VVNAAVKRRKAGALRNSAQPRSARKWLSCAFRRFASLFEAAFFKRGGEQGSGTETCRENDVACGFTRHVPDGCSAIAFTRVFEALWRCTADPGLRKLGVFDDPGSAAHHFVLRRAREKLNM
jgi:hypothetical protein